MEIIKELGLGRYEQKAYEALFRLGNVHVKELCKASSVPYGRIYDIIQNLEEKGLVSILPTKPKTVVLIEPKQAISQLLKREEEKIELIKKAIPNLSGPIPIKEKSSDIVILKGKAKQWEIARLFHETAKNEYVAIAGKFEPDIRQKNSLLHMAKRKVSMKILVQEISPRNISTINDFKKFGVDFRKQLFPGLRMMIKDKEEVVLTIVDSSERISIHSQNTDFAKAMASFFNAIWEKSIFL